MKVRLINKYVIHRDIGESKLKEKQMPICKSFRLGEILLKSSMSERKLQWKSTLGATSDSKCDTEKTKKKCEEQIA